MVFPSSTSPTPRPLAATIQTSLRFDRKPEGTQVEIRLLASDVDGGAFATAAGMTRLVPVGTGTVSVILKGPGKDLEFDLRECRRIGLGDLRARHAQQVSTCRPSSSIPNKAASSRSTTSRTARCRSTAPRSRRPFPRAWRGWTRPRPIRRNTRSGCPASPPMPGVDWRCPAASSSTDQAATAQAKTGQQGPNQSSFFVGGTGARRSFRRSRRGVSGE